MLKKVKERYSSAAQTQEKVLCCPVNYNTEYLKAIPQEVIEKDYGCGDPSSYINEGETVLDLGPGGGKICFIAAQIVGKNGRVIGVDMTGDMLELARRNLPLVEEKIGYKNIEFRHGYIQDLKTDLDLVNGYLKNNPVNNAEDYKLLTEQTEIFRKEQPLVADNSIDVIVSNCVLNLVSDSQKRQLFEEMFRVLKIGGRIAVSDIVSDEPSPQRLKDDKNLWSGCISGALQEREFIKKLEELGFYGIMLEEYQKTPWQTVEGIEYRSITITAYKGKEGPCIEKNQAVIYTGPWKKVEDDDGHTLIRGERMAVCEKTYAIMSKEPYRDAIIGVPPLKKVESRKNFDCGRPTVRSPKETKTGVKPTTYTIGEDDCADPSCAC